MRTHHDFKPETTMALNNQALKYKTNTLDHKTILKLNPT